MSVTGTLAAFAIKHSFDLSVDTLGDWLTDHFRDHSQALPRALGRANDRAWEAVGLALAGDGLFASVTGWLHGSDMVAVRDQIRQFLATTPTGFESAQSLERRAACSQLTRLRKSGQLAQPLDRAGLSADIRRLSAPGEMVRSAEEAVGAVAQAIQDDAPHLARVLRLAPPGGPPLLVTAFVFFFRREVETNHELAHGLTFDSLNRLTAAQDRAFALLDGRTEGILDQIGLLFDSQDRGFAAVGGKIDDQTAILREIQERLAQPKRPGVSYDTDDERDFLRQAKDEFRRNPERVGAQSWGRLGDAMNAAKMYAEAGEAHEVAATTATAVHDPASAAANYHKAYRDACDAGDWERAAGELWRAVDLDEARYRPFNRRRFAPERILGGGAFGTVFLCRDQNNPDPDTGELLPVAIKTLRAEALSRDLNKVLAEAITLKGLRHPNIIGILDHDFADDARTRPFLVLEYFPGKTLEAWLRDHGTLAVDDLLAIARQVASAVHAAHTRPKPVYHRDVKPANIMVLRHQDGTWTVKVIDFGLAVRAAAVRASLSVPQSLRSTEDKTVAGTIKYAPPEQLGELPGVEVGAYSDVYSFGKTCLELLFGHTQPQDEEWDELPESIRGPVKKLFTQCVRHSLTGKYPRCASFAPVLESLAALDQPKQLSVPVEVPPPVPKAAPSPPPVKAPPPPETPAQRLKRLQADATARLARARELMGRYDFAAAAEVLAQFRAELAPYRDEALLREAISKRDQLVTLRGDIDTRLKQHRLRDPRLRASLTQYLQLNPADAEMRDVAEALPPIPELPANPNPGDVFHLQVPVDPPAHQPGERLTLKVKVPQPHPKPGTVQEVKVRVPVAYPRPGALMPLRFKAVPKRPNPNT